MFQAEKTAERRQYLFQEVKKVAFIKDWQLQYDVCKKKRTQIGNENLLRSLDFVVDQ